MGPPCPTQDPGPRLQKPTITSASHWHRPLSGTVWQPDCPVVAHEPARAGGFRHPLPPPWATTVGWWRSTWQPAPTCGFFCLDGATPVDSASTATELVVSDWSGGQVIVHSASTGVRLRAFGADHLTFPRGVSLGADGVLAVTDAGDYGARVALFQVADGAFLGFLGQGLDINGALKPCRCGYVVTGAQPYFVVPRDSRPATPVVHDGPSALKTDLSWGTITGRLYIAARYPNALLVMQPTVRPGCVCGGGVCFACGSVCARYAMCLWLPSSLARFQG